LTPSAKNNVLQATQTLANVETNSGVSSEELVADPQSTL